MSNSISGHSHGKLRLLVIDGIVLLAITVAAYVGVFQNDFVGFDDNLYVTNNPHTLAGLSWTGFRYAWTSIETGNWTPLTFLSYQLDVTLFGSRPAAFQATDLVLHCLNVLLLFAWLVRVTGSQWRSLTVAALFAVHPLHVESVAWIAERKDVLSTFWLLITLFTYEKYALRPAAQWYLATCVTFVLGLLSKPMLVTLPVLLLLIDVWPLARWAGISRTQAIRILASQTAANGQTYPQRTSRELILEKLPLLGLVLLDGVVTIIAQPKMSIDELTIGARIGNSLVGYGWYLAKTFLPSDLSVIYLHPVTALDWNQVAVAAILLTAVSTYVALAGRRRPYLLFGWLWFLIALLPVIGLVQVGTQAYADRYSYIPHIGLMVMIVWESQYWLDRMPAGRSIAKVAGTVATAACIWLTVSQVRVWRTGDTLFARALAIDPNNWVAHVSIGNQRLQADRLDEAFERFQLVLKQRPTHSFTLNNVGWIYQRRGESGLAEQYYRRALAVEPGLAPATYGLVTVLEQHGRITEAADFLESYVAIRPEDATMRCELGVIYAHQGRMEPARTQFTQALAIAPDDMRARNGLALVLTQLGRGDEARPHLEIVLSRQPDNANAHVKLGVVLENSGELAAARDHFAMAVRIDPDDKEAQDHLHAVEKSLAGAPGR